MEEQTNRQDSGSNVKTLLIIIVVELVFIISYLSMINRRLKWAGDFIRATAKENGYKELAGAYKDRVRVLQMNEGKNSKEE